MYNSAFFQTVALPAPFYRLDVFSLIEPVRETEGDVFFQHRLYVRDRYAEGGKRLLKQLPEFPAPRCSLERKPHCEPGAGDDPTL